MVQSAGILVVVTVFTLLGTAAAEGFSAAFGEARTYLITIGANVGAILLVLGWNFWLAPHELMMEELQGIMVAASSATAVAPSAQKGPVYVDYETRRMAGDLQQLGEVARHPRFYGLEDESQSEYNYQNVIASTHVVWTLPEALQLRRDFRSAFGRVFEANMKQDKEERNTAIADMDAAISRLVPILLGTS